MSLKTNTKAPSLNPLPASDVRLFLTNLRLLDFDLHDDWPGITVQTFSAKNADQKQRISATEWALFRLFEIWDINETAQKLQPFFPPLEPLQSLNLRAALFRSLNELKKNGILGRESVIRKTMLDECKGEKFYEILVLFSTAVIKKVLAGRSNESASGAIARTLATAPMLSAPNQQSLLPLAIAHKAALCKLLKEKDQKRRLYLDFEHLLDKKSEEIHQRARKTKETPRAKQPAVSQREAEAVKRQLQDNWIGDQKWLSVMLHGDQVQAGDAFLGSRFDKVFRMVDAGRNLEQTAPETGLLENLQMRVSEQNARLQKWKTFHDDLRKEKSEKDSFTTAQKSVVTKEFKFDTHLQYQLPTSKQKVNEGSIVRPALSQVYQCILSDMDENLSQPTRVEIKPVVPSMMRRHTSSSTHYMPTTRGKTMTRSATISKVETVTKPKKDEHKVDKHPFGEDVPVIPRPRSIRQTSIPLDSEATLVDRTSTLRNETHTAYDDDSDVTTPTPQQYVEPTPPTSDPILEQSSPSLIAHADYHQQPSPAPPSSLPSPQYPSEPPIPTLNHPNLSPESQDLDLEDALAEQILTSLNTATPSPVKKPQKRMSLSLVERTRMSMARTTSFEPVPESPDLPLPPPIEEPEPEPQPDRENERRATLAERTRLSMMAMSNANHSRKSLAPSQSKKDKRKSRTSLFPVNQFDTPRTRKSFDLIEERKSIERTPTEVLFDDTIDYERVFKSRPRIATSPVFSPALVGTEQMQGRMGGMGGRGAEEGQYDEEDSDEMGYEDEGVTGIDLGDVDCDEDEDGFTQSWAESPSRRRRR